MSPHPVAAVRTSVEVAMSRAGRERARIVTFDGLADGEEHFACLFGEPAGARAPLVRLHSECVTGDIFGSTRCDCGPQLDEAIGRLAAEGGVLLYLRQEGRGIGFYNKIDAYALQDRGADTFRANELLGRDADERDYTSAAQMLVALGTTRIRLLTNNPDKVGQLSGNGIDVEAVELTGTHLTTDNQRYLAAKTDRGGHVMPGLASRMTALAADGETAS